MNNAQGADVSKWDVAPIEYGKYGALGPFAIIKATDGLVKDPLFDAQWAAAKRRTRRSPYHFWHSYVNQKEAVHKLLEFLGSDAGELPASLDLEVDDGSAQVMALAHVWVDEYHSLTNKWPIIYSRRSFLLEHGCAYQGVWDRLYGRYRNAWLANCPLWLAEWPFDEIESLAGYTQRGDELRAVLIQEVIDGKRQLIWPKPVAPWRSIECLQWTSRYPPEQVPGYFLGANHKLAVDMNAWRLSRAEFEAAYPLPGDIPTPEPEPEPEPAQVGAITVYIGRDEKILWLKKAEADGRDVTDITTVHFDALPAPDPEPDPEPEVVDDVRYGILRFQVIENSATTHDKATPAVVQLQDEPIPDGRKGNVIPLSNPSIWDYGRWLNNDQGWKYFGGVHLMWINSDYTDPLDAHAESIGCMFNFVSWPKERVQNGCVGLQCFQSNDDFHAMIKAGVSWYRRPDLIWKAMATNIDMTRVELVGFAVDAFIPLMARSKSQGGTGELWLRMEEIEPFAELPCAVTVTASGLNIRKAPGIDAEDIGDYEQGDEVTLLEYRPLGASVWARTMKGWICLLQAEQPGQRVWMTTWHLQTPGVIPPAL